MSVLLRTLLIVKSPRGLRLLNLNRILVFLRFFNILSHLPKLYIGIINHNQRHTLLHAFNCSGQVPVMILADHLGIVDIFSLHHEKIISGVNNTLLSCNFLGHGRFS